jgi:hypothetical protein
MPALPLAMSTIIGAFAPVCSTRVCDHALPRLVGGILAPGSRTVAAVLRVMGKARTATFTTLIACSTEPVGRPSRPVACYWVGC